MNKNLLIKKRLKIFLKIFFTGAIILILFLFAKEMITNTDSITQLVKSAEIFGPIVLILSIILGILFTPIPSILFIITAGYLYGIWPGALYSYIAHILAALGTFFTINIFNIYPKNNLYKRYKEIVEKRTKFLYLLYAIPIIPISITSIISASSQIKLKKFLKIIFISFIPPVLFFSFFGNRISNQNLTEIGIFSTLTLVIFFIAYGFIKKYKFLFFKKR